MNRYRLINTAVMFLIPLFSCLCGIGCATEEGELVIRDRPLKVDPQTGLEYYLIHAGDTPTMTFRSKFAYCSYVMMHDQQADLYEDCGPDVNGIYEWTYTFKEPTEPGILKQISATGYQIDGQRDFMPFNGKLLKTIQRGEPEDDIVVQASVFVKVYSSRIEIPVNFGERSPVWKSARLYLYGPGAKRRLIEYGRLGYDGEFRVEGPDASNGYRVIYEPTIREINPEGETKVKLVVGDDDANIHEIDAAIQAPTGPLQMTPPASDAADMEDAA